MSVLYYAVGGGLGHLTRARAVLRALGLEDRATLLTASAYAGDARVTGGLPVEHVPDGLDRGAFRAWLARHFAESPPDALYLDSFPAGVLGELCDMPLAFPVHHVARRLRLDRYLRRLDGPRPALESVHAVEELAREHERWLGPASPLDLDDPPASPAPPVDGPFWLVVHSGPEHEVAELALRAERARLRESPGARLALVTRHPPPGLADGVEVLDLYPAAPLYPHAERIVTACGFNAMRELRPFRERHRFLPFERPLDDQRGRAQAALRAS